MRIKNLAILWVCGLLAACGQTDQTGQQEVARPVKTLLIGSGTAGGIRKFPGVVDANKKADLAFRVSGKVAKLLVKEGDKVASGQVLAALDPTDFKLVVNDKQASFNRARADYNRAKKLVAKGHISRMDYDRLEADYKSRLADLERAKRDLSYTILKAPFKGEIAQRFIENYEEVRAKIKVFTLADNSTLEVKINVPENIMLRVKSRKQGSQHKPVPVLAAFDAVPGKRFPLIFKEVATRADAKTQTFLVTYTMPAPDELRVLPGMTVNVIADLSKHLDKGAGHEVFYLPITAVSGTADLNSQVWMVDEKTMRVHPLPVKLGAMKGNTVEVQEGLQGGERIVTAGARFMADGMLVTLLKQSEQAEPRAEDVRLSIGQSDKQ